MSVLIEAQTIVIRHTTLNASCPGGAQAMITRLSNEPTQARWVVSDGKLVAASFWPDELAWAMEMLQQCGLVFVAERESGGRQYEDIALVDSLFGLAEHCDWIEWGRPGRKPYSLCWLAGTEPGELSVPPGHSPGEGVPQEEYPRWVPGVIKVAVEPPTEIWLDQNTGHMIRRPMQPMYTAPGPIMEPFFRQLPKESLVRGVRLTDGDAEELHAQVACGDYSCEFRLRTYEHQEHFEARLYWPIDIPDEKRPEISARFGHLDNWSFDDVRQCPAIRFRVLVEEPELPGDNLPGTMLNRMVEAMLELQQGVVKLAGEEEFAWLRPSLGLKPLVSSRKSVKTLSPISQHYLSQPLNPYKRRRMSAPPFEIRDPCTFKMYFSQGMHHDEIFARVISYDSIKHSIAMGTLDDSDRYGYTPDLIMNEWGLTKCPNLLRYPDGMTCLLDLEPKLEVAKSEEGSLSRRLFSETSAGDFILVTREERFEGAESFEEGPYFSLTLADGVFDPERIQMLVRSDTGLVYGFRYDAGHSELEFDLDEGDDEAVSFDSHSSTSVYFNNGKGVYGVIDEISMDRFVTLLESAGVDPDDPAEVRTFLMSNDDWLL